MKKCFFIIPILIVFNATLLSQVIINEVMHLPVNKEPEWIELFNSQDQYIDSLELVISDPKSSYKIKLQDIMPFQYIVLVKDTNLLKQFRKIPDTTKLVQTKIPSLNNSGDSLLLKDRNGVAIDSFYFGKDFGKNGISLERKDARRPADNKENLKPSIAIDSATCGKINSITTEPSDTSELIDEIRIEPNPFSPNSIKNRCKISISSKEYIHNLSIRIYDITGNLVKTLFKSDLGDKFTKKDVEWDGTNDSNFTVQVGPYPIIIEYELVANNKRVTHKSIIVVGN